MKIFSRRIFYPFYLFQLLAFRLSPIHIKYPILRDLVYMNCLFKHKKGLLWYLVFTPPYQNFFYFRIGKIGKLLKIIYGQYSNFFISPNIKSFEGGACIINHPYGTIINAKSIGKNFECCQLTTIGNKKHWHNDKIPTIGDNVSLGANVTIIGDIKIGNNVVVGAGSVVVKSIPNNCVIAGNPAKIIKTL